MAKKSKTKDEKLHMRSVAELGCIICDKMGFPGSPAELHHIISNTGAPSIERFNRTLTQNTMLRLDAMNLDRFKWVDQLKPIIDKYIQYITQSK